MQDDKIGHEAKNDSLIVALGNHWHKRNVGNKLMRKHYVSAVMRLTSRLLIEIRKLTESEQRLEFYLQPKYFSEVAHAALKVAKQDDDNDDNLQAPSGRFLKQDDLPPRGGVCRSVCYLHCQRPRRGTNIKGLAVSNRCSSRRECRV